MTLVSQRKQLTRLHYKKEYNKESNITAYFMLVRMQTFHYFLVEKKTLHFSSLLDISKFSTLLWIYLSLTPFLFPKVKFKMR